MERVVLQSLRSMVFRVVTIFTDTAPIDFKKTGDVIVLDTQGDTMV